MSATLTPAPPPPHLPTIPERVTDLTSRDKHCSAIQQPWSFYSHTTRISREDQMSDDSGHFLNVMQENKLNRR